MLLANRVSVTLRRISTGTILGLLDHDQAMKPIIHRLGSNPKCTQDGQLLIGNEEQLKLGSIWEIEGTRQELKTPCMLVDVDERLG